MPPNAPSSLTTSIATRLNLTTLPNHTHQILTAFALYSTTYLLLSPQLSAYLFPTTYPHLSRTTRTKWNVHAVSLLQSSIVSLLAVRTLLYERRHLPTFGSTWRERLLGYTASTGAVQAWAAGYFLYDMLVSIAELPVLGTGSLVHALTAGAVTAFGFRPFANYYGLRFVLYELSNPLLNAHWFFDKLGMSGSVAQWVNGAMLVVTFAMARVVWGSYQSVRLYMDAWEAARAVNSIGAVVGDVPKWLLGLYVGGNTILTALNFFWFSKIVATMRRRMSGKGKKADTGVDVTKKE